jgi:hypothetical protein
MELTEAYIHVILPFWILVVSTIASCVLAALGTMAFVGFRPPVRALRWLKRGLGLVALILSAHLPFFLLWTYLRLVGLSLGGKSGSFCFGDPHANMLVGVVSPPLAVVVTVLLMRRRRLSPAVGKGDTPRVDRV